MALKQKVDQSDLELLMVLEDPVWFTEFINNTNYGDPNKNNWRKGEPFKLRPYQRELITDKSKNIVVSGGRAIGKCQPASAKVFTIDGWKTLGQLKNTAYFTTYAITPDNQFIQRRSIITRDVPAVVYNISTLSGESFSGNRNHPILTPHGYRLIRDLRVGDRVAKIIKLPTDHCVRDTHQWHELRLMGYFALTDSIQPKFKAIREEIEFCAPKLFCAVSEIPKGIYLRNILGNFAKHPMSFIRPKRSRLSWLFFEKLENIKTFLEAMFSQHAYLSRYKITLPCTKKYAQDLKQLLLYFGIETNYKEGIFHVVDTDTFWQTFSLVGVSIGKITKRVDFDKINENMRWDVITSIEKGKQVPMYAVHVYKDETYIGDGIAMHNSIVLENKLIWEIVNTDIAFNQTHESLLITQNQSQLTPVLDKLIQRFLQSPLLKGFVKKINRSLGTLDFSLAHRLYARIAGSNEQSNVIGLHVNKLRMDEAQMVMLPTYHQLNPTLNVWEPDYQQLYTGVNC